MDKESPIGIFDSGIGGLTVARAVNDLLPNESIIYFGDTAHLPYGDKSETSIQSYSIKICNLLLEQNCKVILIACNSASAAAYNLVKEYVGSKAIVLNVIDPAVEYIGNYYSNKNIGLIGTKRTILSGVYENKIKDLNRNINLKSLATPLLVHVVEEGFYNNKIGDEVIHEYLSNDTLDEIEALILGCTHYPLIKDRVESFYASQVEVIDSSIVVAEQLKSVLQNNGLLSSEQTTQHKFYVSDYTESFEHSTKIFFGEEVNLEYYKLWE